jgi:peptidyl-prolyl cis-trans isomerase D
MISQFREFTKSFAFKILMAVLILSFAVFGMKDVFQSSNTSQVIEAGARQITPQDFRKAFDNYKANMEQQSGKAITYEEAVSQGLHTKILQELAGLDSLSAWLQKVGIRPSPKQVVERINKYPVFFDSITGKFDKAKYQEVLGREGMTEVKFEQIIGDEIANRQFAETAMAGLKTPRIFAALQSALSLETRDTSFLILTPDSVERPPAPTDADLQKFYAENQELLKRPELRQFTVASFAPAEFAAGLVVDEAELQKLYAFRRDTLSTPERRTFVQITVPDQKEAQNILTGLRSGTDPALLAKAHKGTVTRFDDKPKTAVPDRKVADAAFGLKAGDVSGVIQGELGLAVIKLMTIQAGSTPSFESVKAKLTEEYKADKAKSMAYDKSEAFEKDRAAGISFTEAAKKQGVRVIDLPPMTAEGQMGNGQSFAQYAQILKAAFDQPEGGETEITDMGNGEYFALKLNKVIPSEIPKLDMVRPQLAMAWQQKVAVDRVVAKGDEAVARLKKGEDISAVATSLKAKIEPVNDLDRNSSEQKIGPELTSRVFGSKLGEVFQARPNQAVVIVGKVVAVKKPDANAVNTLSPMAQQNIAQGLAQDFNIISRLGAKAALKTKVNGDLAIRALGLDPKDTSAAKPEDGAKGK